MRGEIVWIFLIIVFIVALFRQLVEDPINSLLYQLFILFIVAAGVLALLIGIIMTSAWLYYKFINFINYLKN